MPTERKRIGQPTWTYDQPTYDNPTNLSQLHIQPTYDKKPQLRLIGLDLWNVPFGREIFVVQPQTDIIFPYLGYLQLSYMTSFKHLKGNTWETHKTGSNNSLEDSCRLPGPLGWIQFSLGWTSARFRWVSAQWRYEYTKVKVHGTGPMYWFI